MDTYAELMATLSDESRAPRVVELVQRYQDGPVVVEARQEAARPKAEGTTSGVRRTRRLWRAAGRFRPQLPVLIRRQVALMIARGSTKNRKDRTVWQHITTPVLAGLLLHVAAGGGLVADGVAKSEGLGSGR